MMRYALIVLALFINLSAYAQINLMYLEQNNGVWTRIGDTTAYNGAFIEYFKSGKVKGKGTFKDGLVDGLRVIYYENGNKYLERYYSHGINDGKSIEYFENGKVRQEAFFKDGKEEGACKVYYENGQVKAIFNFVNGVQQGDYFEYTTSGKLKTQLFYIDGKQNYSPQYMKACEDALESCKISDFKKAVELYTKAIELNPTVAQVYFNRGACKSAISDYEGAIKDYDIAIEMRPDYMEAYSNRGFARIKMLLVAGIKNPTPEQTEKACEDLNKAISLGDESRSTTIFIKRYCQGGKEGSK